MTSCFKPNKMLYDTLPFLTTRRNCTCRIHLHVLSGALLAIVLPVTNTRNLPFEPESYWVHHILLYATPIYLIACGKNFTPEPLTDCWWPLLSIGLDFFYHFSFLQGLAMVST